MAVALQRRNYDPSRLQTWFETAMVAAGVISLGLPGARLAESAPRQLQEIQTVWVASGLSRVGPTDPPGELRAVTLFAARGETVDAQIVVRASSRELTHLNISSTALHGPNGSTIPASRITLYREHYITVKGTARYGDGKNPPMGPGAYPEPLIPFRDPVTLAPLCGTTARLQACNAIVAAGKNQPFWIDIAVPQPESETLPGIYTGSITIESDQDTATVPLTLTVWNFALPEQPSELSLFSLWPPGPGNTLTSLNRALMRNRVMGWYETPGDAALHVAAFGLTRSALNFRNQVHIRCSGSLPSLPEASQIAAAASTFPAGISLDLYVGDELNQCPDAYASLKTIGERAHASGFDVKTILTVDAPDSKLFDEGSGRSAIDHWVLRVSAEQWPALPFRGGDLWSYSSCNTGAGNAPEWMIDYPPINERIQAGFLNWTQGASGVLYYRVDGWTDGNTLKSWNDVNTTTCGGSLERPGDGILVYPPGPIESSEPAPGIRLKAVRDGIEDFEYAQALSRLGHGDFVHSILDPIAASWTSWSHNAAELERARLELGRRLDQIASSKLAKSRVPRISSPVRGAF